MFQPTDRPIASTRTTSLVLAVFTVWIYLGGVLDDTTAQQRAAHIAAVTIALLAVARDPQRVLGAPNLPARWRAYAPSITRRRWLEAIVVVAAAIVLITLAQGVGQLTAVFWPIDDQPTYNDVAITGNSLAVDLTAIYTAAVGEELLFRLALLGAIAAWIGNRFAVAITAVTWALAHTGFENGYPAALVVGLVMFGIASAVITLATRSLWPAIIAHGINNLDAVLDDHQVDGAWLLIGVYAASFGAAALLVAILVGSWRTARRDISAAV